MTVYEIQSPKGKTYEIEAESMPSGAQLQALLYRMEGASKADVQPEAPKSAAQSFLDRGVETAKGLGSLALDAGKSALTIEGQAKFLPRMAANMYEGAVQSGADAITRQQTPTRKALAAVPVLGPYVMNAVSDIEEGKGAEVAGRTAFDALTLATPAKAGQVGRATVGAAKSAVPVAVDAAKALGKAAVDPLTALAASNGAAVGAQLAGPLGATIGGGGMAALLTAPKVFKAVNEGLAARRGISVAQAEAALLKMPAEELAATVQAVVEPAPAAAPAKASADQVLKAQNRFKVEKAIRQGNAPARAYSYEQAGLPVPAEVAAAEASRIKPIPPNKLPPVLPDPVVPEITPPVEVITKAPEVRKPRAAKPKPVQAEPVPASKEPWQMTRDEYLRSLPSKEVEISSLYPGQMEKYTTQNKSVTNAPIVVDGTVIRDGHHRIQEAKARGESTIKAVSKEDFTKYRKEVTRAVEDGKPVPKEVLEQFPELAPKVETGPTLDPIMMPAKNDAGVGPLNITAKLQDHAGYKELVEKVRGKSQEEALQILADAELKDWLIRPTMEMAGLEAPSAKAVRGAVEAVKDRKWDEWQRTAGDVGEGGVVVRPHPGQASPAFVNERLKYLQDQAVKRGDGPEQFKAKVEANKSKGAELAAALDGSEVPKSGAMTRNNDYRIAHRPMEDAGGASRIHDLTSGSFDENIYGKNALQYYGSGDSREASVLNTLKNIRGKSDAKVTIYRGVPEGVDEIAPGDWVTLSESVAKDYADRVKGRVISMEVRADDVTASADSILENGYSPRIPPAKPDKRTAMLDTAKAKLKKKKKE